MGKMGLKSGFWGTLAPGRSRNSKMAEKVKILKKLFFFAEKNYSEKSIVELRFFGR